MTRALFCGSRAWTDAESIGFVLSLFDPKTDAVLHGSAKGADLIADAVARERGFTIDRYPADWRGKGRGAGPTRNRQMLRLGRPDVVFAFKGSFDHTLKTGGTENMVAIARKAGVPCVVFESPTGARKYALTVLRKRAGAWPEHGEIVI